ncbi:MAG: transposase [Parcubacteria group bacterium]
MKKIHRQYPKRYYITDMPYFLTSATENRYPYFSDPKKHGRMEEIFCELLVKEIFFAKKIFRFKLYGFVVLPEHIHLLIKPLDANQNNYSKIMAFIKRHYSRNLNEIFNFPSAEFGQTRLKEEFKYLDDSIEKINGLTVELKEKFYFKYKNQKEFFKKFKWQQGFHYRIINSRGEFCGYLNYLLKNPAHHGITPDWQAYRWSSANPRWKDYIDILK